MEENLYEVVLQVKLFLDLYQMCIHTVFISVLSRLFEAGVPRRQSQAYSQRPAGREEIPTDKWAQIQCKHHLL